MKPVVVTIDEILQNIDDIDFSEYFFDYDTGLTLLTHLYYTSRIPKDKFYSLLVAIEENPQLDYQQKMQMKHTIASILLSQNYGL